MAFCVMHCEKRKMTDVTGLQKENNRTAVNYNNKVSAELTPSNIYLTRCDNWQKSIQEEIDRAGARVRKNSTVAIDLIYSASKDFFNSKTPEESLRYFQSCFDFHQKRFGHIVNAVIHLDESTPHMHVVSIPLTKDNRLSARDVLGGPSDMMRLQTDFFNEVGKAYGLERGERRDGPEKRKHITAQQWELNEIRRQKAQERNELERLKSSQKNQTERRQKAQERARDAETRERHALERLDYINDQIEITLNDLKELEQYMTRAEKNRADEIRNRYADELER